MSRDWSLMTSDEQDEMMSPAERAEENYYAKYGEPDTRDEDNACPECDEGVVETGPMEWETGHYPYCCSMKCGFSG